MSDLIDRQAALDVLCDACGNCACPKGKIPRCSYYEKMQAIPTASPWHRVEDGLPEEDVEVLISYRYKEGEGDTSHVDIDITSYGQMYFGGREVAGVKHWRPPFEYFSSNYEVIAWMPLPEPPKEDA